MRQTKRIIVLGYTGTGKTTFLQDMINNALKKPNPRIIIITPDDSEWLNYKHSDFCLPSDFNFFGTKRHIFNENYTMKMISEYAYNSLILLDDCRFYITSQIEKELHGFLIRSRQHMNDIVAIGHGFTEVPPKFFTFASHIVLFHTKDNINKRKDYIKDFSRMVNAQIRVNQKSISDFHYKEIIKQ